MSRHYATNVGYGRRALDRSRRRTGRAAVDLRSCCGVMASTNRYRSRSLRLPCRQRLGARSRGGKPRQSRCPHALPACAFVQRIETTWARRSRPEEWLLIEWPEGEEAPTKYWFSTLPRRTSRSISSSRPPNCAGASNVTTRNSKQEVGSVTSEGRGWRGFHHHATLCIAAYGFLVSERGNHSPLRSSFHQAVQRNCNSRNLSPEGLRHCGLNATFRIRLPPSAANIERRSAKTLSRCPCCVAPISAQDRPRSSDAVGRAVR